MTIRHAMVVGYFWKYTYVHRTPGACTAHITAENMKYELANIRILWLTWHGSAGRSETRFIIAMHEWAPRFVFCTIHCIKWTKFCSVIHVFQNNSKVLEHALNRTAGVEVKHAGMYGAVRYELSLLRTRYIQLSRKINLNLPPRPAYVPSY